MEDELFEILTGLAEAEVRFLVVGGVAVVLHGHPRFTADLDLIVDLEPGNALSALRILAAKGFRPRPPVALESFADPAIRKSWIEEKGLTVFSLWSPQAPGTEIDLFVEVPFDFARAYGRAALMQLGGTRIPVVALRDLIELKRRAGRPKDFEDIAQLEAIEKLEASR